jgi:hypothetical protein
MRGTRLTAVGEEEIGLVGTAAPEENGPPIAPRSQTISIQMLTIALKALSQRAVIAVSNLFMLLTAASVFVLWYNAPAEPSTSQLVRLGLYGVFVLVLNIIHRRK